MVHKSASLAITMIVNIAAGVAVLFIMLIAMNGYSESDATWGLGFFVLSALVFTLLTSIGAFFATGLLDKKGFSPVVSALVATFVFAIIGIGLFVVCSLIGVGVAEFVRVNY